MKEFKLNIKNYRHITKTKKEFVYKVNSKIKELGYRLSLPIYEYQYLFFHKNGLVGVDIIMNWFTHTEMEELTLEEFFNLTKEEN